MRLTKIVDNVLLQVYSISEASKEFKLKYPKKFIVLRCFNDSSLIKNTDKLLPSHLVAVEGCVYIFTYKKKLSKEMLEIANSPVNDISRIPCSASKCLDRHFISDSRKCSVVFKVSPKSNIVPIKFSSPVVVKASLKKLNLDNLGKQLAEIANEVIKNAQNVTVEEWLLHFLQHSSHPINICIRFPNEITDEVPYNKTLKSTDLFIEYDVRANSYEEENKLYTVIGDAFEQKNSKVTLYDTYNGLLSKAISALEERNIPYNRLNDYAITFNYKYLRELPLDYKLTDFL